MRDVTQMLPLVLLRARESIMVHFRPIFAKNDVTEAQWRVLRVIGDVGEINFSDLSDAAVVIKPSLSRVVRDLTARGLTERRDHPEDHRQLLVSLTDDGRALLAALLPEIEAGYARIAELVSQELVERLSHELQSFIALNDPDAPVTPKITP